MNIEFKIIKWNTTYELLVDNKQHLEVKHGNLRDIFYEMEKFGRLRFKGELNHHKKMKETLNRLRSRN